MTKYFVRSACFALLIALVAGHTAAQNDLQIEIERDVWNPLFKASNLFDAEGFLSVQSRDLVRISLDLKEIYGLDRYRREITVGFKRAKDRGIVRISEARFLDRNASGEHAYETGYFRSEVTMPNGEKRVRFSKFEFVLRKENGKWRILVDKDTADGGKITAEEFSSAAPMRSKQ